MPITIRELLASDTISQAADKINFNFDQLLLNGGGPQGPQGPQGPPGPIGGRGIRGSVWYEGTVPPTATFPTTTPEDEDNYLQSNGDVWTYDAAIPGWVNTGVNLTGPTGPTGASGKFAEYEASPSYGPAGDTTIFPDEISLSPIGLTQGVRSVLIGGFPESPAFTPTSPPGTNIVPSSIASQLQMPDISMMVHQFSASGRGIVFHGGDATENFEQVAATDLSSIGISNDDLMVISVPKEPTLASVQADLDGFRVLTPERNQLFQAGKRIWLQAGTSSTQYGAGDLASVWIETDRNSASIPDPTIELRVNDTAVPAYEAELRLGGFNTAPGNSSKQGDFWVEAGLIDILSNGNTTVDSGQGITMTAANNIVATSSGGDISLSAASGGLFSTSQTVDVDATDSIDIDAGTSIDIDAGTTMTLESTTSTEVLSAGDINIHSSNADVHIYTDTSSGGNVLIDTNNTGSQIKLETDGDTSPIKLTTNGTTSPIRLETTGASSITLDSNTTISLDAFDSIAATAINTISTFSGGDTSIRSTSNIVIDTSIFSGTGNISLLADTGNINMTTTAGDVNITASDTGANGNVNITSGGTSSEITLKRTIDTTVVRILSGGAASGSYLNIHDGNTPSSSGISLRMETATTGSIVAAGGTTDTFRIAMPSTVKVEAETGVLPSSGGSNFDPRFDVDASIDVSSHTGTYTAVADEKIFGSGTSRRTGTTQGGDITMNWIRVGNIVTCTGVVTGNSGNPVQPAVALVPIRGASITDVFGVWNGGGGGDAGRVEAYSSTEIRFLPNPEEIGFYFSFSYRIQ